MAITLTPQAISAAAKAVTRPIYLIQIGAGTSPSRLTTGQAIIWRGVSWSAVSSVDVSGLSANGSGAQNGQIRLGNTRLDWGALVLGEVRDAPVKVWAGDASAVGDDDLRLVFDGVIDAAEVSDEYATLTLAPSTTRSQFSPRRVIGPDIGLNVLLPAGSRVPVGTQVFVIER